MSPERPVALEQPDRADLAAILDNYLAATRWADSPGRQPQEIPSEGTVRRRALAKRLRAILADP